MSHVEKALNELRSVKYQFIKTLINLIKEDPAIGGFHQVKDLTKYLDDVFSQNDHEEEVLIKKMAGK